MHQNDQEKGKGQQINKRIIKIKINPNSLLKLKLTLICSFIIKNICFIIKNIYI
jgi:hypothetical protein